VDGYQAQLAYFVECAVNGRHPELCDPQESADAVELTRLISEARRMRGAAVAV
jgi:hypothetical protein